MYIAQATAAPNKKHEQLKRIKLSLTIEYAASRDDKELPIEANIKPALRPIILMTFAAKIAKIAIPTIDRAIGNVARDFIGLN
jgi:hypothetical protein